MSTNGSPKTLFEKIWNQHVVVAEPGNPSVLYIDLHLVHEVTSPQAFTGLREKGLKVRRPNKTVATMDHGIPTTPPEIPISDVMVIKQISQLEMSLDSLAQRYPNLEIFALWVDENWTVHEVARRTPASG